MNTTFSGVYSGQQSATLFVTKRTQTTISVAANDPSGQTKVFEFVITDPTYNDMSEYASVIKDTEATFTGLQPNADYNITANGNNCTATQAVTTTNYPPPTVDSSLAANGTDMKFSLNVDGDPLPSDAQYVISVGDVNATSFDFINLDPGNSVYTYTNIGTSCGETLQIYAFIRYTYESDQEVLSQISKQMPPGVSASMNTPNTPAGAQTSAHYQRRLYS